MINNRKGNPSHLVDTIRLAMKQILSLLETVHRLLLDEDKQI